MKAFIRLAGISIQSRLYYKTSFFIDLVSMGIPLLGQYLLWYALYRQQGEGQMIGGIGQQEMFSYILVAFALNNLLSWSSENKLSKEIKNGTVVARCIRPVSFLSQNVADMMGALLVQGIINMLSVLFIFAIWGKYFLLPTLSSLVLFLPCVVFAILLRILLVDVFSLLCFYSTGHLGISWTRIALFDFFSGALIPVVMFPQWLKAISYATPFPYMMQVPIALLLGQELPVGIPAMFLIQLLWVIIFLSLHCVLYRTARKNMVIAGG